MKRNKEGLNKGYKYLLSLGHLFTDMNQGALPAILPFLILLRNFSYTSAAGLVLAVNLISSVIQPLFGYWGDKFSRPWLMSLGILLAGTGIALIGLSNSYQTTFAAATISGLGIALFHPEGGKLANFVAGEKKGTGLGIFIVGGNFGFVLGPIAASVVLVLFGLNGTLLFLIPAGIMSAIYLKFNSEFKEITVSARKTANLETGLKQIDEWNAFIRVALVISCRSIMQYSLLTFIPLYFIGVFFQSEAAANINLIVFSLAGAIATIAGGRISDSVGFRRTVRVTFFTIAPLMFFLLQTESSLLAALTVIPIGFAISSSAGALVAMAQGFVPNHIGLASGISLGLGISVGGVCAPLIGLIGDAFGLRPAMYAILAVAVLAWLLTLILPKAPNS